MYCRKCYVKLDPADPCCRRCYRVFNPADPSTYLTRPFPGVWKVIGYVLLTTVISIVAAFVVSFFQMAAMSGH